MRSGVKWTGNDRKLLDLNKSDDRIKIFVKTTIQLFKYTLPEHERESFPARISYDGSGSYAFWGIGRLRTCSMQHHRTFVRDNP